MRLAWVSRRRHEDRMRRERDQAREERDALRTVLNVASQREAARWRERDEARARAADLEQEREDAREEAYWRRYERDICRKVRERAQARVAELEQAIGRHCQSFYGCSTDPRNERLWRVLGDVERREADSLPQHGVATGGNLPPRGYSSGTANPVSEWRTPAGLPVVDPHALLGWRVTGTGPDCLQLSTEGKPKMTVTLANPTVHVDRQQARDTLRSHGLDADKLLPEEEQ